jgi:hypothetical protein
MYIYLIQDGNEMTGSKYMLLSWYYSEGCNSNGSPYSILTRIHAQDTDHSYKGEDSSEASPGGLGGCLPAAIKFDYYCHNSVSELA